MKAYPPSEMQYSPQLACTYISTGPLQFPPPSSSLLTQAHLPISTLYSRFKPLPVPPKARRPRGTYSFGYNPATFSNSDSGANSLAGVNNLGAVVVKNSEHPAILLTLEQHERFVQICAMASVVLVSARIGMYVSCAAVGNGVIRVFRDWLAERAVADARRSGGWCGGGEGGGEEDSDEVVDGGGGEAEEDVLWVNGKKDVGLRMRVVERADLAPPGRVVLREDEDDEVVYCVEFVEVIVRTVALVEKLIEVDRCEV